MKHAKIVLAAVAAGLVVMPADAAPASKMKVKMAESFVKTAERGGAMSKSAIKDARQRINDLLKSSDDDPDVIALDERLKKLESAPAEVPKMQLEMARNRVDAMESGRGDVTFSETRRSIDDLLKLYGRVPPLVALDERLNKLEKKIAADKAAAEKEAEERAAAEKKAAEERAAAERKAAEERAAAERKAAEERAAAKKKEEEERIASEKREEEARVARREAKAKRRAAEKQARIAAAHKVPCPWVMDTKKSAREAEEAIHEYIKGLGRITNSKEVGDLKAALEARAEEDRKIVAEGGEGADEAKKELSLYNDFYYYLGYDTLVGKFDGTVDLVQGFVDMKSLAVWTRGGYVYVMTYAKDKKLYFFDSNGSGASRCFLEDEDLLLAVETQRRFWYVDYFLMKRDNERDKKNAAAARVMFNYIGKARENNSPDIIDYRPMPAKGALHDAFAEEALVALKKQAPSYAPTTKVVIDADNWDVERRGPIIKLRRFGGWALRDDKYGTRAFRVLWCQDCLDNGEYGRLRLHSTGGSCYVK